MRYCEALSRSCGWALRRRAGVERGRRAQPGVRRTSPNHSVVGSSVEQEVLLQSREPRLRSEVGPAPCFHRCLTVKFRRVEEAAQYTRTLPGLRFDQPRDFVEMIHKGAKRQRPPKVKRCGSALVPVYELLKQGLRPSATVEQTHMDRSTLWR